MLWKSSPAATELEQITLSWVLEWLGLPSAWFGMIVDSASNAVLQAIVAARQRAEPESRATGSSGRLVAYVSEHTHSSVEKAAIAAGIGQRNVRHIATDAGFRMKPEALAQAIRADLASNLKPFFAAATVGTTSSTAVDPVAEISRSLPRAWSLAARRWRVRRLVCNPSRVPASIWMVWKARTLSSSIRTR